MINEIIKEIIIKNKTENNNRNDIKYIKRNDKVKKKNNKGYYKEDYKRDNDKSKNENNNRK